MNKKLISWSFPEYNIPNRKKGWYIWASLFFLALLIYAIFTANFLFGLIIIIAATILFISYNKKPEDLNFVITADNIQVENFEYDYHDLKKFWIVYEPPYVKNLYFDFKSSLKPTLIIPLGTENPVKVRKILKEFLTEDLDKESESTTEALARILKL